MRRIPDNRRADNKIMTKQEEWQVVRRTEVMIETHTVTTVRRKARVDAEIIVCESDIDTRTAAVPDPGELLSQYKWRRS